MGSSSTKIQSMIAFIMMNVDGSGRRAFFVTWRWDIIARSLQAALSAQCVVASCILVLTKTASICSLRLF